jgi:hypothetical protein
LQNDTYAPLPPPPPTSLLPLSLTLPCARQQIRRGLHPAAALRWYFLLRQNRDCSCQGFTLCRHRLRAPQPRRHQRSGLRGVVDEQRPRARPSHQMGTAPPTPLLYSYFIPQTPVRSASTPTTTSATCCASAQVCERLRAAVEQIH